jgi:hypothetical protein
MQAEKALVSDHDFKNIPRSRAIHKSFVHLQHFAQGTHIIIHNKEFMSTQIWLGSSKLTPFSSCPSEPQLLLRVGVGNGMLVSY